jgi:hypothetical protein
LRKRFVGLRRNDARRKVGDLKPPYLFATLTE